MAILRFLDEVDKNKNDIDEKMLKLVSEKLGLDEEGRFEAEELYRRNTNKLLKSLKRKNNILVNGEVQSGKTNNLIVTASSLNKNEKYDLIIYLTGRLNAINDQNHSRFFDIFKNDKENYFIAKVMNPKNIDEASVTLIKEGKTMLMNMLKINDKIEALIDFIESYKLSFILINDEGDDASLSEKGLKSFKRLSSLPNKKIITITASPYENLMYENLYQDYIILESSSHYTGIDKFKYITVPDENQLEFIINEWLEDSKYLEKSSLLLNSSISTNEHSKLKDEVYRIIEYIMDFDDGVKGEIAGEIYSTAAVQLSNSEYEITDAHKRMIIIGGHNLSRGVTFQSLTHQLLISSSEQIKAATLIQRARWCGYRDAENTKVYLSANLKKAMRELVHLQKWTKKYKLGMRNYKKQFKEKEYKYITLR